MSFPRSFLSSPAPDKPGKALLDGLRARGVLVRWWSDPAIEQWLRISVGTEEEMDALLAALQEM